MVFLIDQRFFNCFQLIEISCKNYAHATIWFVSFSQRSQLLVQNHKIAVPEREYSLPQRAANFSHLSLSNRGEYLDGYSLDLDNVDYVQIIDLLTRILNYRVLIRILFFNFFPNYSFLRTYAPSTNGQSTTNSCNRTILPPVVRHNTMPDRKDHEIKGTALWKWCGGMK